ncbi:MAG: MFS transporter [Candidatus Bathyarchaeia archaeon]
MSEEPRSPFIRLLRQARGFLPLFVGDIVSTSGAAIFSSAISYLVYLSTHSALAVAYVGIASFAPTIIIGLFAGALVDRSNKRRMMVACDLARSAAVVIIPVYMFFAGFNLAIILSVVLAISLFSTLFRPAARAIMPLLVQSDLIPSANGIMTAAESLANSVSLGIGGVLIELIGASLSLFYNTATYLISATMIFLILVPSAATAKTQDGAQAQSEKVSLPRKTSLLDDVREGVRYMREKKVILEMTATASAINFFAMIGVNFLVVYEAKFLLTTSGLIYGILLASFSFGSAVGALVMGRVNAFKHAGKVLIACNAVFGLSTLGMILLRNVVFDISMLFVTGLALGLSIVLYFSIIQIIVPGHVLGRVISADEVGSFASIPLAQIAGGLIIQFYGIIPDFEVAGIGLLLTALASVFLKDLRTFEVTQK